MLDTEQVPFKTKPYDHQLEAIKKWDHKNYFALFMEQGTGKSKVAIDICSYLYQQGEIDAVLLVAPNGVQEQWYNEQLPLHCKVKYKGWVWKSSKGKLYQKLQNEFLWYPDDKLKWFCANIDVFSTKNHIKTFAEFVLNHKTAIVVDESTTIKNPKANRTTNIIYNMGKVKKQGRKVVDVLPFSKYRFILTGTMITNSPYDLWSMFEFLKHDYFGMNFYIFKNRYGMEIRDTHPYTGQIYHRKITYSEIQSIRKYLEQGKPIEVVAHIMGANESTVRYIQDHPNIRVPYKNLEQLKSSIKDYSYIIRKEDCLDLPPKVYEKLYVEMSAEQKRVYKELVKELMSSFNEKELTVQNKVSLVGRLQQITGGFFPYSENGKGKAIPLPNNPKLKVLIRDLEETDECAIIIWARYVAEIKLLTQELKKAFPEKNVEAYYGGVDKNERVGIISSFKRDEVDILIANPATAGIGLNLQNSHFHYYYSNSYSLYDRAQSEDRSHRSGQKSTVLYKDIIVRDTVDEKVYDVLKNKRDLLDYFRDNSLNTFLGGQ